MAVSRDDDSALLGLRPDSDIEEELGGVVDAYAAHKKRAATAMPSTARHGQTPQSTSASATAMSSATGRGQTRRGRDPFSSSLEEDDATMGGMDDEDTLFTRTNPILGGLTNLPILQPKTSVRGKRQSVSPDKNPSPSKSSRVSAGSATATRRSARFGAVDEPLVVDGAVASGSELAAAALNEQLEANEDEPEEDDLEDDDDDVPSIRSTADCDGVELAPLLKLKLLRPKADRVTRAGQDFYSGKYWETDELPSDDEEALLSWFEHLRTHPSDNFRRWMEARGSVKGYLTGCAACKVIKKEASNWPADKSTACSTCLGLAKKATRRPCFKLVKDEVDDDGNIIEVIQVLPAPGKRGLEAFKYFKAYGAAESP